MATAWTTCVKWYGRQNKPMLCRFCQKPVDPQHEQVAALTRRKEWVVMHLKCYYDWREESSNGKQLPRNTADAL